MHPVIGAGCTPIRPRGILRLPAARQMDLSEWAAPLGIPCDSSAFHFGLTNYKYKIFFISSYIKESGLPYGSRFPFLQKNGTQNKIRVPFPLR